MDKTSLVRKIEELQLERDSAQSEAEGLKIQLHVVEDKWQNINTELNDTIRKLKEGMYLKRSTKTDQNYCL